MQFKGQHRCCCSYNKQSTSKHLRTAVAQRLKKKAAAIVAAAAQKAHWSGLNVDPLPNLGGFDHIKSLQFGFNRRNITMT